MKREPTRNKPETLFNWTPEAVEELGRRVHAGESGGQIAAALGCSRNAVIGKCVRMGLRLGGGVRTPERAVANSLVGRIANGNSRIGPDRKPKPARPPQPARRNLTVHRGAPDDVGRAKAEAYLASPSRAKAFNPEHAPKGARLVKLEDLQRGDCKWPLYEDGPMLFCGCQVTTFDIDGQPDSYCEAHMNLRRPKVAS